MENPNNDWLITYDSLTFEQKIGVGYFGEVYRGEFWGTDVAIKKILKNLDKDDQVLGDLRKEAAILGSLRHPNVVLFMGLVEEPEVCIVTEFCHRGSLFDLLHNHEMIMDFKTMMKVGVGIAKGMTYLHCLARKIIHRDLKSHNVLIGEDWTAKICDFGISHVRQRIATEDLGATKAGHYGVIGTPEWMAPEILQGEAYDESADVYSYGIVLTEILTRQMPYRDRYEINGYMDVVDAVLDDEAMPTIPDWSPEFLADIIVSCLDRDPSVRPRFTELMEIFSRVQKIDAPDIWFGKYDIPRLKQMLSGTRTVDHLLGAQELGLVQGTTASKSLMKEDNDYFVARLTELLGFWNPPLQSAVCHTLCEMLANSRSSDEYMDVIIEGSGHEELRAAVETYQESEDGTEKELVENARVLLSTLKPKLDYIEAQQNAEYQQQFDNQQEEQEPKSQHQQHNETKQTFEFYPAEELPPPLPPPTRELSIQKPLTSPIRQRPPPPPSVSLHQRTPPAGSIHQSTLPRPPIRQQYTGGGTAPQSYPPRGKPPQPPRSALSRPATWNHDADAAPNGIRRTPSGPPERIPTVTFDTIAIQNEIASIQNEIRKLLYMQQQLVQRNDADAAIQIQYEIKKLKARLNVVKEQQGVPTLNHERRMTLQEEVLNLQNEVRRKTYAQGKEIESKNAEKALQLQLDIDNVNTQLLVLQNEQATLPATGVPNVPPEDPEPASPQMDIHRLKSIENALTQGGFEALKNSSLLDNRIKNFNTWKRKKHRRERTRERSRLLQQGKKTPMSRIVLSIEDHPEYNKELTRQAKEENVMVVTVKTVKAAIDFLENNYDYSQGSDEFRVMTCLARDSDSFFKRKKGGAEVIKKLRKKGYKGPIMVYAPTASKARHQLSKNGISIQENIHISDSFERTLDFVTFSDEL